MRVGVVRNDMGQGLHLDDLLSRNQYPYASQVAGQSRVIRKPTDAELGSIVESYPIAGVTAALVTALKTAVYPTSVTINVSQATIIGADAAFGALSGPNQAAFAADIAEAVAPYLVETGDAVLSFAAGKMAAMKSATFQPGGARAGLPAGIAIAAVEDDGSTPFT